MNSKSAFSRTELLVAIGTVAVLIGVVTLVMANSRRAPRKYTCLSNLKDWGAAMTMYEKDNNGRLPFAFIRYGGGQSITWDSLVFPYVRPEGYDPKKDRSPKGVLRCPSDPLISPDGERRRTYSMPAHSMRGYDWPPGPNNDSGVGLFWQNGRGPEMASLEVLTNAVGSHPQSLSHSMGEDGSKAEGGGQRVEESAGRMPAATLNGIPAIRLSMIPAPAQTLLLTEQVRSNNVAFQVTSATIRDPNGHVDKSAINPEQIHQGKFNYLMVDGHVETMSPMQSVGKSDALLDPMAENTGSDKKFPNVWTIRTDD